MTSPPLFSVLMPVHNGEAYLAKTIESVLNQTLSDFEFIIVDDGSTDLTGEIVSKFARRDSRIKEFRKVNSGISETLNIGLANARAEWISRIDADDLMLPSRLERQSVFIREHPDAAAFGSYYDLIDSHGTRKFVRRPLPRTGDELDDLLAREEAIPFTHPTMAFRKELALKLGGYRREFEPCEDGDLFARILQTGAKILVQPEVLTQYRVHENSISSGNAVRMYTKLRFIFSNFYRVRNGEEPLSQLQFETRLKNGSIGTRMRWSRDLAWHVMMVKQTAYAVQNRQVRAAICLASACLLRPDRLARRGLREISKLKSG
ncbi:glycosyltransferase family 2 protein [Bradyrhizobium sp. RDM12]